MRLVRFALVGIVALIVAEPLCAQAGGAGENAQVLVLGTYHFASAGQNVVQTQVADVLMPTKQAEIRQVTEALELFRPTKIAIESLASSAARIDSLYQEYRLGSRGLSRGESEQLGFRLAATLGHETVHPIDYQNDFPFGAMMEYAQAHDAGFVTFVEEELARIEAESARHQREHTVGQILRLRNEPEQLKRDHGVYMRFAGVGAGDTYVGADVVASWYDRNIRIFATLQQLVEPGDRVLVIFGAGHALILRQLVAAHPDMALVDPLNYLPHE
jgi:hypothetical protein